MTVPLATLPVSEPSLASQPAKRKPRRLNNVAGSFSRWMLPSIGSFCLLLILYLLLLNAWRFLQDSDTGWHIRTGDLIRQTGTVPRHDVFSHTMPGSEWFAWEWLADVLMSHLHENYGLAGITGAAVFLLCLCYALLYQLMKARGSDSIAACALTLLAAMASLVHWLARPHLLSILLMLVWCAAIESWRRKGSRTWQKKLIYALPLLVLLWANLHGAFAVTFAMLVVYAVGDLLENIGHQELRKDVFRQIIRTYVPVGLASALATLVTPYGFGLWQHLWHYLTDTRLLAQIDEFQSPDFHTLDGKLIELLSLLAAIAGARAARMRRFTDIGLLLLWSYLTLQSQRHVTLAAVVMTPIIAEHSTALLRAAAARLTQSTSGKAQRWQAVITWYRGIMHIDRQLTGASVYAAVAVFLLLLLSGRWNGLTETLLHPRFDERTLPVAATEFIARSDLKGNPYAPDQFGGYLIYRLYPEIRVFVDGRSDFYRTGPLFDEYLRLATIKPDWAEILNRYDVRWLLLRRDEPLSIVARATGQWIDIYHDHTAQVLVRKE